MKFFLVLKLRQKSLQEKESKQKKISTKQQTAWKTYSSQNRKTISTA